MANSDAMSIQSDTPAQFNRRMLTCASAGQCEVGSSWRRFNPKRKNGRISRSGRSVFKAFKSLIEGIRRPTALSRPSSFRYGALEQHGLLRQLALAGA